MSGKVISENIILCCGGVDCGFVVDIISIAHKHTYYFDPGTYCVSSGVPDLISWHGFVVRVVSSRPRDFCFHVFSHILCHK